MGEGNGNPLQHSCLENPVGGGAWQAAVHGVTKSRTRVKWATSRSLFTFLHWRRKWQPTPVSLPGKSNGCRSLGGYSPWGHKESDTTERLHFHALEKEMATHSSVFAWRIPGTAEPGGLPSMMSHRVGHDWSDLAAAAAAHSIQYILIKWITFLLLTLRSLHLIFMREVLGCFVHSSVYAS